ncbi:MULTISPECIES: MazG nucleotide pyrophosphohydrolase domain-containing protein [Metallosphaera]|uniref:MazG nucleotide pyrophosphohydrolase n=3 Tax=Metallosphaera TaxID=41980 RepID=A4YDC0_METS5|nr:MULTISPECIES: MazG nucleotide pyrophosphohydrolase domain-containing protein [Metallosphaera]ABP94422.1 MazG nucleotide pyrophosphohydrolase [Metallosphaera sedula DSM 5348]AIM26409.1 MazG nucleotide pyrophosphohydrolase [Metallosphaera sedula]AKV73411.1 nucleotide pyrophosphohydrolase [Metallosphaera sedula]AKV75654.1 nucleotide pyrophosphohydrolase [Metallosphaera sedula]AKV77900.1 nucleotide pyrophosphohydrolase [Metallosphaera sedula]
MEVRELQNRLREMYFEKDKERGIFGTFTWFTEEVGELAEALLQGKRGSIEEELADVIAWAISIANLTGIDVEEALKKKYGL